MITDDFKIKLIDFGFGAQLSGTDGSYFMNTPLGTATYKAPEIIRRENYQGSDVDIFSLGVTILTLRLMEHPFKHASSTLDGNYKNLMHNSPLFWINHIDKNLSEEFKNFVVLML